MLRICYFLTGFLLLTIGFMPSAKGQEGAFRRLQGMGGGFRGGGGGVPGNDSLKHRTGLEDSITIRFRYLDSSRLQTFDSTIYDFTKRFPIPWYHVHLGNLGSPTRSLVFTPIMQSGWDPGFHAYDVYTFNASDTRFYNTTRPFTQLTYVLGSRTEQTIGLLHTQNIRPNWNASFQYRLINSPGIFQNQPVNHNNYRFSSWYQSNNRRYQNFVVFTGNKLQAGENGGIKTDRNYLDSAGAFDERFTIPTQLGSTQTVNGSFFNTSISTGSFYTTATYLMRQQYDLGQKDSIVTDSTVIPLFYPRLRLEHTISYSTYNYRFRDNTADSAYYSNNYDITLKQSTGSFFLRDYWRELLNDFSIYQFPDAKNSQQFIKAGIALQNLTGSFDSGTVTSKYHNLFLHGEYRNKTRDQKWDIEAFGRFYLNGLNAGDYNAYISLKRLLSKKLGYLQAGFQNTNRTPSFVFDNASSFQLAAPVNLKKENISNIFGSLDIPRLKLLLSANYYLISNLTYYRDFYNPDQATGLFNLLEVSAFKRIPLGGGWNWKAWLILQQRAGNSPVYVPLLTTRNTIGYDGNLGFKNLDISFGAELRYFTPYKAPAYSPLIGQFFLQDATTVKLDRPDVAGYLHFRIKTFSAYVRVENLNTLNLTTGSFTKNNVPTINYPYPGLQLRIGIFWDFIN